MKPQIFIGSSAESRAVAEACQEALEHDAEVTVWTQGVFELMRTSADSLEDLLGRFDFGLFVFTPDDTAVMRGQSVGAVRDNVVFELGLFAGHLGLRRTFIIVPRGTDLHLPTDLYGLNPATYEPNRQDRNLVAAVGTACTQIKRAMEKIGPVPRPPVPQQDRQAEEQVEEVEPFSADFFEPKQSWTQTDYERRYFFATMLNKGDEAKAIDVAFRASDAAQPEGAVTAWEARREFAHLRAGGTGSLAVIRSAAQKLNSPELWALLAAALALFGEPAKSAKAYRQALHLAPDAVTAAKALKNAVEQARNAKEQVDAGSLLAILRDRLPAPEDGEDAVLDALGEIALLQELKEVGLAIMERRASAVPDNTSLRFDLAYRYSEAGHPALAAHHYEAIPGGLRSGTTWNNLGVAYNSLEMPGRAVAAYSKASELGETLADANLSDKLRIAGFFAEAQQRADTAMRRQDDYHPNLVHSLEALRTARVEEDELAEAAKKRALAEQAFREQVGIAALAKDLPDIAGAWDVGGRTVEVTQVDANTYHAFARFEEPFGGALSDFFLAQSGGGLLGTSRPTRMIELTYTLKRLGNALEGSVSRTTVGQPPTLLGSTPDELLLHVADDGLSIHVWQRGTEAPSQTWVRASSRLLEDRKG